MNNINKSIEVGSLVKINKPEYANNSILMRGGHGKVGKVTSISGNTYMVDLGHSNQVCYCSINQLISYNK